MDSLLDQLLGFATEMLQKHGEFFPFAGVLTAERELQHVAGYTGDERPASADVIRLLEDGLRERNAEGIRAVAVVSDVRASDPATGATTDAVCVHMEHREGDALDVFLPYEKKRFRGIAFGEVFASPSERTVVQ